MQRRRRSPSSLLGGSQTLELGLKVAALGPCCGPGALDEGGFQPGGALAHAGGSTLAGAFVVPGTQAGPRDQMTFGREAVHVDADLGNDDLSAEIADAGDGAQDLDRGAKGLDMGVDLLIDLTDSGVDRIDMLKEQP